MKLMLTALLLASCITEWKLLKVLNRKTRRWIVSHSFLAFCISIALSYYLGVLFGAAGLIALAAGIISSLIMSVFWVIYCWYEDKKENQVKNRVWFTFRKTPKVA